ncbi:MAG: DNA gyrase C-terminal beta-propeller domain-containing protein, partial [Alphaproteobacteria bacterium]
WGEGHIVFATASGNVRRNRLDDFTNVMANGKIAMKLDPGDRLIGVAACQDGSDILLAARSGRCTRFPVSDVRVFSGRTSTGVRGVRLDKGDELISLSILDHVAADTDSREAYLRAAMAARRLASQGDEAEDNDRAAAALLNQPPYDGLAAQEQFILTITENGFGKRSSAYEYRAAKRGGKGYANIITSERNGPVVASFPVTDSDQIMLVSDRGRIMRCPVDDIRIAGRATQGVTVFSLDDGERTVSVSQMAEDADAPEDPEEPASGPVGAPDSQGESRDGPDDSDE